MVRDYLESILKDFYKTESDRADKLDGAVNLPTAILTVLFGVGALYLEKRPNPVWNFWVVAFYIISTIYFFLFIFAGFCLIRSYFHYRYRMTANPQQIVDFESGMREHYEVELEDGKAVDDAVKRELQESLIEQYAEASQQNRQRNLDRTNWLFRTTRLIIAALVMMIASNGPLFFGQ